MTCTSTPLDTPIGLGLGLLTRPMRRDEAVAILRGHLPAIRRDFDVRRLALVGSTARDEAREDGDVDLLVEWTS